MYLWPPRPEKKISPDALSVFDNLAWKPQVKKNGTCTVLSYDPADGQLEAWTRHKEKHLLWQPDQSTPCLRRLRELRGGIYVLVGELLHSKVKGIRDTLYLFDILVADGQALSGQTLDSRVTLLHSLWTETPGDHYNVVDERLWTSNFMSGKLRSIFDSLSLPEDEGLVLKDPMAKLGPCLSQVNNQGWQVKCRRSTKNYSY